MTPCDPFRPLLVELAYDELSTATADTVHAHLASCPACRDTWHALRSAQEALAAWTSDTGSLSAATIVARAQWREQQQRVQRRRRIAALVACAAAVLIGVGLGLRVEWDARHVALVWGNHAPVAAPVTTPPDASYAQLRHSFVEHRAHVTVSAWPKDLATAPTPAASYSQLRRELNEL